MTGKNYILGIDTSCDDTSFALFDVATEHVISNVISSQTEVHAPHGGIVPELASRAHLENISLVFHEALNKADATLFDIKAIAVTNTPGLIGCLLVGTSFARSLAYRLCVPLYAVNHLEGHLFSPFIEKKTEFPFLGLVVSGGHTAFYRVMGLDEITVVGQTVDDAAGEAFDKCAKMLGLGYPGGPVIDRLAKSGNNKAFAYTKVKVKRGEQYLSFSGLKTAAYLHLQNLEENISEKQKLDFCASFQHAVVESICDRLQFLLDQYDYKSFAMSGGVAMNSLLRKRVQEVCAARQVPCVIAAPAYCADNGAMIAHVAHLKKPEDQLMSLETLATKKKTMSA